MGTEEHSPELLAGTSHVKKDQVYLQVSNTLSGNTRTGVLTNSPRLSG